MHVTSFSYSEFRNGPREWILEKTRLGNINLLVGRNATGKSRFLNTLNGLSALLTGQHPKLFPSGTFDIEFEDNRGQYTYHLRLEDQQVAAERLSVSGDEMLERREDGSGSIYAQDAALRLKFKVPATDIAAVTKRDAVQHGFLEPLHKWASSVRRYQFGSDLGHRNLFALGLERRLSSTEAQLIPSTEPEKVIQLYVAGYEAYGKKFDDVILSDLKRIGYQCNDVGAKEFPDLKIPTIIPIMIFVRERDLETDTTQIDMSQGMYRALALLINLNYSVMTGQASCILIDDIGEGLDFERSTALIKLLIRKCRTHKFQLLMSTNDRFVMNYVPLEHWRVLVRTGATVRTLDKNNAGEQFEQFKYVGLSNFDFFANKAYLPRSRTRRS